MNKFDIIRMIADAMEECGYNGSFGIYHVSNVMVISMILSNRSISETMTVEEICMCHDPEYKIRSIVNNMINNLAGGNDND